MINKLTINTLINQLYLYAIIQIKNTKTNS